MAGQSKDGTRRALWAAGAALVVIVITRGALPAPVVVLGAVAAFLTVMLGLRPEDDAGAGEAVAPVQQTAPVRREATEFEKAAVGLAPASAAEPAVASAAEPAVASATEPAVASATEPAVASATEPAAVADDEGKGGAAPALPKGPREGSSDDLKKIKGVGPKLETTLHRLGVYHYDQIAGWTAAEVAWVDENLEGFKGRVTRDDWVAQARILALGGGTEFSERAERGDAPPSQG